MGGLIFLSPAQTLRDRTENVKIISDSNLKSVVSWIQYGNLGSAAISKPFFDEFIPNPVGKSRFSL